MNPWFLKPVLLVCVVGVLMPSAFSQEDSAWRRGRSTVPSRPATQPGSGKAKKVSSISRRVDGSSGTTGTKPDVDKTEPAVIPDPKADLTPAPQAVPAESELPPLQDPLRAASDIDSRKLEKERRYKDLQSRIRMLLDRDRPPQEKKATPEDVHEPPVIPPAAEHGASESDHQEQIQHGQDSHAGDGHGNEAESTPSHPAEGHDSQSHPSEGHAPSDHGNDHGPDEDSHSASPPMDLSAVGHRMVDSPIDRVSLANNLYVVGEFGLALKMYESIVGASLSADDENWIRLQIAGCLRKLGRRAEAQQKYRQLAAKPEAGQINELARWWLQQMNERTALEEDLKRYENVIRIQKEAIDAAGAVE